MKIIKYVASPTAVKFHHSNKFVRCLDGPIGCGKSVAAVNEVHILMATQAPNIHGQRLTKGAVVRNTLNELRTTTIPTWRQWFPPEVCTFVFHPSIRCTVRHPLADGTEVISEVYFMSMDSEEQVRDVLSLELSWAYINEAREVLYPVVDGIKSRLGRFPAKVDGYKDTPTFKAPRNSDGEIECCTVKKLIMDTNRTDEENWYYKLAFNKSLKENPSKAEQAEFDEFWEFFHYPGAYLKMPDGSLKPNPDAENIDNLPGGFKYYREMMVGASQDFIDVMVCGEWKMRRDGKPVYPEYGDAIHCAKEIIDLDPNLPVGIGIDGGLTPAAVIGQLTRDGALHIIAELSTERMSLRQFARDVLKPFCERNLYDCTIAFAYCDPAEQSPDGQYGGIAILNDTHIDFLNDPLNMPFFTEPAPTNKISPRTDAVKSFLTRLVDEGKPAYQLSPVCKLLHKGKMGGYHYRKLKIMNGERYHDVPEKNEYSHVADAEQYLALGFLGYIAPRAYSDEMADTGINSSPTGY